MRKMIMTAAVGLSALFAAAGASAAPTLSFDNDGFPGGTLTYDGEGGALIGTDIGFNRIVSAGTLLNDGTMLECVGCILTFETGANTNEGPDSWDFSSGGTFTLFGDVFNGMDQLVDDGVIIAGTFSGTSTFSLVDLGTFAVGFFLGAGIDQKHEALLEFYGITGNDFVFANTEIALGTVQVSGNGGFTAGVTEADINNTAVPEPGTLGLLGLGLLGAGLMRRRRAA